MKRTKLQSKIIHVLARQAGISTENYRLLVFNLTNGRTETSTELSANEADELIKALGGTPPPRGKGVSRRTQQRRNKAAGVLTLATPPQLNLVMDLAIARWGDAPSTSVSLGKLVQRVIKKDKIKTSQEAQKVIEILKAMNARDARKQEAA